MQDNAPQWATVVPLPASIIHLTANDDEGETKEFHEATGHLAEKRLQMRNKVHYTIAVNICSKKEGKGGIERLCGLLIRVMDENEATSGATPPPNSPAAAGTHDNINSSQQGFKSALLKVLIHTCRQSVECANFVANYNNGGLITALLINSNNKSNRGSGIRGQVMLILGSLVRYKALNGLGVMGCVKFCQEVGGGGGHSNR